MGAMRRSSSAAAANDGVVSAIAAAMPAPKSALALRTALRLKTVCRFSFSNNISISQLRCFQIFSVTKQFAETKRFAKAMYDLPGFFALSDAMRASEIFHRLVSLRMSTRFKPSSSQKLLGPAGDL